MFNKKFLTLLLALALVFTLASCVDEEPVCEHVDADDDYNCDKCGEHFDDGDENVDDGSNDAATISVTFKVVLDDGAFVPGVKFTLTRSNKDHSYVSGADGSVVAELEAGLYYVNYDYDSLPEGCLPDTSGVKVEEGTKEISLILINNIPDGSAKKPFPISDGETAVTLAAGETLHYNYRGSSVKYLSVDVSGVEVSFGGDIYSLEAGNLPLTINPQIGEESIFALKNTTESELSFTLYLESPVGSYENPIELSENSMSVTVNYETVVYYNWTVTKDGVLTVTSDDERNNIHVRRIIENDVPIDRQTNGELSVSMEVKAGDVITIGVSALEANNSHANQEYDIEISFTLSVE